MSTYIIEGGHRLSGSIKPQGAKNEALEVISATLLTSEPVTIHNVPNILDVINLINLLKAMRVKVDRLSEDTYRFQADDLDEDYISSADFVARCASLRGSVLVVGPLLARLGQAYFAKPGGDKIGRRRVDTHITGLSKLGAMIAYNEDRQAYYLVSVGHNHYLQCGLRALRAAALQNARQNGREDRWYRIESSKYHRRREAIRSRSHDSA